MGLRHGSGRSLCAAGLTLALAAGLGAQTPAAAHSARTTPEQARKLFALVDELLQFSSQETGLPVKSPVHRRLTTRAEVEHYLIEKMKDDKSAQRLQRDEIVLKKFGLLDRDFALKPFLLALLKEQIEAYYDARTKTVNLLDWVEPEEQKPVLAHELTHALQDQSYDLERWGALGADRVSTTAAADRAQVARDEMETAREAVVEGQATAVMFDYQLRPLGKSLAQDPEVMEVLRQQMNDTTSSPRMARAPLLLSESLLFPYRDGLGFEQKLWMDRGRTAAFAGALDRPPSSSWEILNPSVYEQQGHPAIPVLPDLHPLVDKLYRPYDLGQIGQLDLHTLLKLIGGDRAAQELTPAWNGGYYWAGKTRASGARQGTDTLGLLYLSGWSQAASAEEFARLYGESLGHKYKDLRLESTETTPDQAVTRHYATSEGPVLITVRGRYVFVAEGFSLDLARALAARVLDAQAGGASVRTLAATQLPASAAQRLMRTLHGYGELRVTGEALREVRKRLETKEKDECEAKDSSRRVGIFIP